MHGEAMSKKRIFYGWYVVVMGCLVLAMTMGITSNSFGQFIKPICADMGFTRQEMSMNQTIMSLVSLGFALIWGRLSKKIRLHRWMCVCAVLQPVIFFCFSFAQNAATFYLLSFLMGLAYNFISMMIFTTIAGNWFVKNRGVAIGITSMGSGVGGMIMNPVISSLMVSAGWRGTYQILSAAMALVIIPGIWFIVREKPADKGLLPYGLEEEKGPALQKEGIPYGKVVRMPAFWCLAVITVLMVIVTSSFSQTLSPHLSDSGYTVAFAAVMASVSMGALAVGKVILGRLFDQLGVRTATAIACCCTLAGTLGMVFCTAKVSLAALILGVGLGCSFAAICVPIIIRTLFGNLDFDSIYGKLFAATGIGSAITPVISGRVYDLTGSYTPFFIAASVIVFGSILVLLKLLPSRK